MGHTRDCGASLLEGYPVDTARERISGTLAYVGTTGLFETAGFTRVVVTDARSGGKPRWVVRLEL